MKQKDLDWDLFACFFPVGGDRGPTDREQYTGRTLTLQFTELDPKSVSDVLNTFLASSFQRTCDSNFLALSPYLLLSFPQGMSHLPVSWAVTWESSLLLSHPPALGGCALVCCQAWGRQEGLWSSTPDSDRVGQVNVSLVGSIMIAYLSHILQSHFHDLHYNLLLSPWVNHSFLLKKGMFNYKKILVKGKKYNNVYKMPNSVPNTSYVLYKWQLNLLCSSNHDSFVASIQ